MKNIRIGELLVESGVIREDQLKSALAVQGKSGGKRLGDILIDLAVISEAQLMDALKKRLNVPLANLRTALVPAEALREVPEQFARAHNVLPLRLQGNTLEIATADPLDYDVINQLSLLNGRRVETALAPRAELAEAVTRFYSRRQVDEVAEDVSREREISEALARLSAEDFSEVDGRVGAAPIVRFVNTIIEQAFFKRASDVHIEPAEQRVRVRFRVDGDLIDVTELSPSALNSLATRVKIMGGMDIAERRLPLDGRFNVSFEGVEVSVRVSSMPTVFGEKIVLRLLTDNKSGILKLTELGMTRRDLDDFDRLLSCRSGIVLVTGPTGSGKTTTLYSVLSGISTPLVNLVTIEDPVEKVVPGACQTQINPKAGLTFASGLRAMLRQDPDIIMLGEIRDAETAEIASRAAITGHLVLSCLHTNDAASAYMRLVNMGVEPYIVASSVAGVTAQRLVKFICPKCKEEYAPSEADASYLRALGMTDIPTLYYGRGCDFCNMTGHYGRTAVHEVVRTDGGIRDLVTNRAKTQDIVRYLRQKGQRFLMEGALKLLGEGKTDAAEVFRTAGSLEE